MQVLPPNDSFCSSVLLCLTITSLHIEKYNDRPGTSEDGDSSDFEEIVPAVQIKKKRKHVKGSGEDVNDANDFEEIEPEVRQKKKAKTISKRKHVKRYGEDVNDANDFEEIEPEVQQKKKAKTISKGSRGNGTMPIVYSTEVVLETWNDTTDYGKLFRSMDAADKEKEVVNLNKNAAKGMKGVIKTKILAANFQVIVAKKLREHIETSRASPESMFHCAPKTINVVAANLNFISVEEWVEVDADRTPGYNSEGGIAVIIAVHDDLADVKYVIICLT